MKKAILFAIGFLLLISCSTLLKKEKGPMIFHAQSRNVELPVSPTVFAQLDKKRPEGPLPSVNKLEDGFTLSFCIRLDKAKMENVLLEIPNLLTVCTRLHNPKERNGQNYSSFPMQDGSVPVLEASLWLTDKAGNRKPLRVGIPLSLMTHPFEEHSVCLQFTGIAWSLYIDNRLYDNDFAFGYPDAKTFKTWKIDAKIVDDARLYLPALILNGVKSETEKDTFNIQFWTPPYHNAWVGDVVSIYHKERYHIFYLFDRRGHASKFGKGGHYFEHLSTKDFKNWTEHEPATSIENQWESHGTGTPFVFDGKLCLSYGLHTTRMHSFNETALPLQWEYLEKNGHTATLHFDSIPNLKPAGSTYAISEDGISHFKQTRLLFHPCENPSIYSMPDGTLRMLANYGAKGTWASDSVSGGWKCINEDFPIGGDCTFPFHWNGYDYIIGGFSRLWYKQSHQSDSCYIDMVREGIDFYNGMSVPAITEIPGNRFLMAGWMKVAGWGGPLVIHELTQDTNGRIGNKWMEELVPITQKPISIATSVKTELATNVPEKPFILCFEVHPSANGKGRIGLTFTDGQTNSNACEWQFQAQKQRAQFAPAAHTPFAPEQKTLREGGDVSTAQNYAIENGMYFSNPFMVRMLIHPSAKAQGTFIDVEIGQQRTMLSYRPGLSVRNLKFHLSNAEIRNVEYAVVK